MGIVKIVYLRPDYFTSNNLRHLNLEEIYAKFVIDCFSRTKCSIGTKREFKKMILKITN